MRISSKASARSYHLFKRPSWQRRLSSPEPSRASSTCSTQKRNTRLQPTGRSKLLSKASSSIPQFVLRDLVMFPVCKAGRRLCSDSLRYTQIGQALPSTLQKAQERKYNTVTNSTGLLTIFVDSSHNCARGPYYLHTSFFAP